MTDLKVEYKNIKELIPYCNNSRTHSDDQVLQIASSIKEFGFTNPVLIDGQGGIIAGHGRIMAAQKLKMDEVPTIGFFKPGKWQEGISVKIVGYDKITPSEGANKVKDES